MVQWATNQATGNPKKKKKKHKSQSGIFNRLRARPKKLYPVIQLRFSFQNRGILRGAPLHLHKPEATVIENTPHIS